MRSAPITFNGPFKVGRDLHPDDQSEVLRAYVHRNSGVRADLILTDAEWLAGTFFAVRKDGRLRRNAHRCECAIRDAMVSGAR